MPDKAHSSPISAKIKQKNAFKEPEPKDSSVVITTRRTQRSQAMFDKIVAYGVPASIADSFPLTPHEASKQWCKKLPTPRRYSG